MEATQRAKQEPRSSLQKYCLVSGVVLAYDQAQTRTLEALRQNVQKVDPETPLVECLYKNQLKEGKLSAAQGFTHLENRYQVGKLHLMDAQFASALNSQKAKEASASLAAQFLQVELNASFGAWQLR